MTIQELLKDTGNRGVRGQYTLTLANGRQFEATHIRHPYGDERTVGFSGADYGEIRVSVAQVAACSDQVALDRLALEALKRAA